MKTAIRPIWIPMIPGVRKSYILRMPDQALKAPMAEALTGIDYQLSATIDCHRTTAFSFPQFENFTSPQNQLMLCAITRQELEAVAQPVAVANKCTQSERRSTCRQGQLQCGDFARFQLSGKGYANTILSKFDGSSPKIQGRFGPEHFHRHSYVQRIAWIAP